MVKKSMVSSNKCFYLITAICTTGLYILLAFCVKSGFNIINIVDSYEHHAMTGNLSMSKISVIHTLSNLGSPIVAIFAITLISLILCYHKQYLEAFFCETSMIIGNIIAELCKFIIARPRPSYKIYADNSFSFPSGHVFDTTLLVLVMLTIVIPKLKNDTYQVILGTLLIIWNGFIIFSRIFLGEHYFTDTLGSVLLAIALWTITLYLKQSYILNLKNRS